MSHPALTMPRTISTPRLTLSQVGRDDTADLMALYSDRDTARFLGGPFGEAEAFEVVAFLCGHWRLRGNGFYAARTANGALAGVVGLLTPPLWPDMELTYTLSPASRGKGYATEAVRAVGVAAFDAGAPRLVSYIDPHNAPSKALARRVGARHAATILLRGLPVCVFRYAPAAFTAKENAA